MSAREQALVVGLTLAKSLAARNRPGLQACAYCGRPTRNRQNRTRHADGSVPSCPGGRCRNRKKA